MYFFVGKLTVFAWKIAKEHMLNFLQNYDLEIKVKIIVSLSFCNSLGHHQKNDGNTPNFVGKWHWNFQFADLFFTTFRRFLTIVVENDFFSFFLHDSVGKWQCKSVKKPSSLLFSTKTVKNREKNLFLRGFLEKAKMLILESSSWKWPLCSSFFLTRFCWKMTVQVGKKTFLTFISNKNG